MTGMSTTNKRECTRCFGKGTIPKTSWPDGVTFSLTALIDSGQLPRVRVTKRETCPSCGGSGERR